MIPVFVKAVEGDLLDMTSFAQPKGSNYVRGNVIVSFVGAYSVRLECEWAKDEPVPNVGDKFEFDLRRVERAS